MLRSKLKFETAEDRRKAAEKIRGEAEQVSGAQASFTLAVPFLFTCSEVGRSSRKLLLPTPPTTNGGQNTPTSMLAPAVWNLNSS